ncbi:hypothetical protein [Sphingobium sp.]|uniref:hypothetical protein n=1 Tax=Sphingobium sp. TaxID=1912891 RepID=UPI003BB4F8E4
MSKFARTAAMVVGAVALIAATAGMAAPAVAATATTAASAGGIAGISAATLAAVGTYGSLAAGVLSVAAQVTAPGFSQQGSATSFQTNPQSGLPYAMGRTRMSGLRIFAATSNTPGYTKAQDLLWFGALLTIGGQIDSIERFTADNEVVSFNVGGNANGRLANYMAQRLHMGGLQASGLATTLNGGSPPGWTSQHKLSGITHAMWGLRFSKDGDFYGAGAPEPAWIGKWVKVYDPRLDSTYPGGSGPCRALNEATYVWSQNPGLHALTWALGRWENGKRTCGIGAPIANIRVAEFVECANVDDANGWKVGGVEWTTDSKWDTLKRILQAGGAVPTQTGAMIGCLVSTPRTAIATIHSHHLHDGLSLPATKRRRDRFNSVIPRYVDEDSDWAVISGKAVTVPEYVTADKGQRTKEIDFPLVQVFSGEAATQPGQLAAYAIVNSREAGPFTWSTGPEWIGLKTGDVVYLNVPEEGLVNQPVLITRRSPDPATGKVSFAGDTETYSKHPYALGQSTTPPTSFSLTAPDLTPPAPSAAAWAVAGGTTGEGLPCLIVAGSPEHPSADAVLVDYRIAGSEPWSQSAILRATANVLHIISPLASNELYEVRVGYRVDSYDGLYTILPAVRSGSGKLSTIEEGATNSNNADSPFGGKTVGEVLSDAEIHAEGILAQALRQDDLVQVLGATNFIDGQPVSTTFLNFRDAQEGINEATATTFDLMGTKGPTGTNWNLDLVKLMVSPTQNLGQKFSELAAIGTLDDGTVVKATVQFLREVFIGDGQSYAKTILRSDVNGTFGAFSILADGVTRRSTMAFIANEFYFVDQNGGNPTRPLTYVGAQNGEPARWEFGADIYAKRIVADVIETKNIKANQVTGTTYFQQSWGGIDVGQLGAPGTRVWATFGGATPVQVSTQGVTIPLATEVTITFFVNMQRTGSDNDRVWFRLRRESAKTGSSIIGDTMRTGMSNFPNVATWAWLDKVPVEDQYLYTIEIWRDEGGGTYFGTKLICEVGKR